MQSQPTETLVNELCSHIKAQLESVLYHADRPEHSQLIRLINLNWTQLITDSSALTAIWDEIRSSDALVFKLDELTAQWLIYIMPCNNAIMKRVYEHLAYSLTWMSRSTIVDALAKERCVTHSKLAELFESDPWLVTLILGRIVLADTDND